MIAFFQSEFDSISIQAFSCEVCKLPILDLHRASVILVPGDPEAIGGYRVSRGIIAHDGKCERACKAQYLPHLAKSIPLSDALGTALLNAGLTDIPASLQNDYVGNLQLSLPVPTVPPTSQEIFRDELMNYWEVLTVDERNERISLGPYQTSGVDDATVSYAVFQSRFRKLQNK